ncbi:MAG: Alginate export, partial [Steroidobacteraceae bacterium]|nr:Alginate export [Steroidobacteraceae bacterium]
MRRVRTLMALAIVVSVCLPAAAQEPAVRPAPAAGDAAITSGRFTYRLGVGYMFHASARQDYAFHDDQFRDDETFAWWRLRPRFAATSRHVDVVLEGQDTHGAGGSFASRKGWLDVLNAYVEVKGSRGWSARVGRQQGDLEVIGRLVRQADFVAVLRTIDVAAVSYRNASTDVRGFVFKPVDSLPSAFNRQREGERLWAAYGRRRLNERTAVQSYVVARHNREVLSETGAPGNAAVYAWQVQVEGPTPHAAVDWAVETVLERGHYATDDVRAWAVFLRSDIRLSSTSTMDVRYTVTSPDVAKGDGVRAQFDHFYGPATYFSFLGQIRGSNVRAFSVGGATRLRPRLTLNWRYFATALHDRRDLWYGAVSPNLANAEATSTFLGHEIDGLLSFQATP